MSSPQLRLLMLAAAVSGCSEYAYTSKVTKDAFQQRRKNTVDVLMVVDNSCSMFEEQDKLAANFESFIDAFDGIEVDWQIGVVTTDMVTEGHQGVLRGGDDELILSSPDGRVLDRVSYTSAWGIPEGVAMQLSSTALNANENDSAENWCIATDTYGDGDLGTPGLENNACSTAGPPPPPADTGASGDTADTGATDSGGGDDGGGDDGGGDDGGGDDGGGDDGGSTTDGPNAGDLIFTEFMPDPSTAPDSRGEWVELTNLSDDTIDLSGFLLTDLGRNAAVIPDGTTIAAGARIVIGRDLDTEKNGGVPVDAAVTGFTLNNDITVLTTATDEPAEIFSEMVAVGVDGSGIEMGLASARAALSEPLLSTTNAGFLREDANLSLIFVSDENDFSADTTSEYYLHFASLKSEAAYRDHGILNFSAVVGRDVPPAAGAAACESENGLATYGARYIDLASRTDGALESICDDDFSPIAAELGLLVSGLELEFVLTEPCDETSLEVMLYESETATRPLEVLVQNVDYSFNIANNSIVFGAQQVPPSETWIVAEYQVLARSTDREDEGTAP